MWEEEISFSNKSQSYCVCFVSMVDSIENTSEIKNAEKIRRYYSIFVNTMAAIARNFGAKIVKNTGISLVYFFPKTSSTDNKPAFRDVIECGVTMIAASDIINEKLREEGGLPPLYYRISADYGSVEVARSITSPDTEDLFGSTMNVCSKINSIAPPNEMVIGSDLYYCIGRKSSSSFFNDYRFKRIGEYSIAGLKHPYQVYSVLVSKSRLDSIITPINKNLKPHTNHDNYQQQQQQKNVHNILLVDDEPDILLTYKTFLLATVGYNVDMHILIHKKQYSTLRR
jgi:class 3 adenylate cyclase